MGLLALLGEALGAIILPCSATVVVTSILVALVGRGRRSVTAAMTGGVVLGGAVGVGWGIGAPDLVVGVGLAIGAVASWWATTPVRGTELVRRPVAWLSGPVGGMLVGMGAGLVWFPCVGLHLATVINTAIRAPWDAVPALALYLGVLTMPAQMVTMLARTDIGHRWVTNRVAAVATIVLVGLGAALTIGLGDDATALLFRWST